MSQGALPIAWSKAHRWSDNDHYLGPFTYSRGKDLHFTLVLDSGEDDYPGCSLRLSLFHHTLLIALPQIIQPSRRKVTVTTWDAETVKRLGRDWYWDEHRREFGFSISDGFLQVFLGPQTMDSSTTKIWTAFLPWTQWQHVRRSLYDLNGDLFWTEPEVKWRLLSTEQNMATHHQIWESEKSCPTRTFSFTDFDGDKLTVKTRIEEREWHFGTGWFSWLRFFHHPKILRSLDLDFSGETGRRKGSWKGGTTGHSIQMLSGELHEAAFWRYCQEHEMMFGGSV